MTKRYYYFFSVLIDPESLKPPFRRISFLWRIFRKSGKIMDIQVKNNKSNPVSKFEILDPPLIILSGDN